MGAVFLGTIVLVVIFLKIRLTISVKMSMRLGLRICAAIFAGFVCHSILVFVWGESGIAAMKELRVHKSRLEENISRLEEIHIALSRERDELLYDEIEIELRSRALGFRRADEVAQQPNQDVAEGYRAGALVQYSLDEWLRARR